MTWRDWFAWGVRGTKTPFHRAMEQLRDEISCLSPDEAKRRVYKLLEDDQRYVTRLVTSGADRAIELPSANARSLEAFGRVDWASLPPSARELFLRYSLIQERFGDTILGHDHLGSSQYAPDMLRLGISSGMTEIVVKSTDDTAERVDGSERSEEEIERFPSVFHLLLFDEELRTSEDLPDP